MSDARPTCPNCGAPAGAGGTCDFCGSPLPSLAGPSAAGTAARPTAPDPLEDWMGADAAPRPPAPVHAPAPRPTQAPQSLTAQSLTAQSLTAQSLTAQSQAAQAPYRPTVPQPAAQSQARPWMRIIISCLSGCLVSFCALVAIGILGAVVLNTGAMEQRPTGLIVLATLLSLGAGFVVFLIVFLVRRPK